MDLTDGRAASLAAPTHPMAADAQALAKFVRLLPAPAFLADRAFRVVAVNDAYCALFGYAAEALLERDPSFLHLPDDAGALRDARLRLIRSRGEAVVSEHRQAARDGSALWTRASARMLEAGGRRCYLHVVQEVDEAAARDRAAAGDEAQARLRARFEEAMRQRDMLVREVHHRIKNNLQGVAGLLQQTAARRPEVAAVLDEVAAQIQAIAQIHGIKVREGDELQPGAMAEVVLRNLERNFGACFEVETGAADEAVAARWRIPEQEAVPLALVLNEIGTNAIKHRRESGRLGLRIEPGTDHVTIAVWNEGTLPPEFDFGSLDASSSGLGLVKAMLPRRGARLGFEQHAGRVQASLRLSPPALRQAQPATPALGEPAADGGRA